MRIRSQVSQDPSFHRENLKIWLAENTNKDPEAGVNINNLVGRLLAIFSDNPPFSWRFRITTYRNPIFRVHVQTTGRDNDFLVVGSKHLVILHKFFDEKFRSLFPRRNDYYGTGDGSEFDVYRVGDQEQRQYLEAIKSMATDHPEWYIRHLNARL